MSQRGAIAEQTILRAANDVRGLECLAEQMGENAMNLEITQPMIESVLVVPVAGSELSDEACMGMKALSKSRGMGSMLLALSMNTVEDGTHRSADAISDIAGSAPFTTTYFHEAYSSHAARIGNIRKRLGLATALATLELGVPVSDKASMIIGDIDPVVIPPYTLRNLHIPIANGSRFSTQAAVLAAQSQDLRAVGLLGDDDYPQMDRVLRAYNLGIAKNGFTRHDKWHAMPLMDYLSLGGHDETSTNREGIELIDRLAAYHNDYSIDLPINPSILENPRRLYQRLQSGGDILDSRDMTFRTVNDQCRGKTLEGLRDISRRESDVAINVLWRQEGYYGIGRTLADAIVWYLVQVEFGRDHDGEYRNPAPGWQPDTREMAVMGKMRARVAEMREEILSTP